MLERLVENVCPHVIPEEQCGYRPEQGTMDMIFSARQVQQKCLEEQMPLYQVFINLTKAFDMVNRDALWIVLCKLGCPTHFVSLFEKLHSNMKAQVVFNGNLSDEFSVDNGVKQGDIPAPTLFSIYFAALLCKSEKNQGNVYPTPGQIYTEPNIFVNGTRLEVIDTFVYLETTLSRNGGLDAEIYYRIAKGSAAFGKLEKRVWADRDISLQTKISIYKACVLTALLYSGETWTIYKRYVKMLERFYQKCLRRILGVKWKRFVADTEVLRRAHCSSIEKHIILAQMRWTGHVIRMKDDRLPKRLFYGEISSGERPRQKPSKRYKDCIKQNLKKLDMYESDWEGDVLDRSKWRAVVRTSCDAWEEKMFQQLELKRACRKGKILHQGLRCVDINPFFQVFPQEKILGNVKAS
ncbi:uncharacterized protein LOC106869505 [Octopus bimaculoides]|uniref:uncharacterized protein LOC106869505 n=1 Tax=Octopus bimaculoides TaxID=37653 RepID=UPI00071C9A47|nr:uncharacterized protein LOC106869505 [Octopus bimaculoides]|eukprot:XP_014770758.1 PREDICTED: uncharacterized protein LOC106869505 [Octopus bimaculoides]